MRRRTRGFTLLEMIVAVGIMVLVAATAAESISVAFKIKRAAEDAVDSTRDTEIVGEVFMKEIRNAMPPNPLDAQDPNAASGSVSTTVLPYYMAGSFIGDNGDVSFYTTGPDPKADVKGDVRYVEFTLVADKYGNNALVRRQRVNLLEDTPSDPTEEVLANNILSLVFRYWDGTAMVDNWDSTTMGNVLPYGVQMQLTLAPVAPGMPERTITRFAAIPCAAPSTQTSDTITSTTPLGQ